MDKCEPDKPEESAHSPFVDEVYKFAATHFAELDQKRKGFISSDDLDQASKSGLYKGVEANYIKALKDNVDSIAALNDDGWFTQSQGISAADLLKLDYLWHKRGSNITYAEQIKDFGLKNFHRIDFDNSGQIQGYELVSLTGDGVLSDKQALVRDLNGRDKESLGLMRANMEHIGHPQPITKDVWIGKPWQYTTEYGITREELNSYPGAVAHRPQYDLLNKLEKDST